MGKRLLRLRIQGTTRPIGVTRLGLRFAVALWGPLLATALLDLRMTSADLASASGQLEHALGLQGIPALRDGVHAVLRALLIPNLVLAIPWLGTFLFALFDDQCRALHDRAARTRVVYDELPAAE